MMIDFFDDLTNELDECQKKNDVMREIITKNFNNTEKSPFTKKNCTSLSEDTIIDNVHRILISTANGNKDNHQCTNRIMINHFYELLKKAEFVKIDDTYVCKINTAENLNLIKHITYVKVNKNNSISFGFVDCNYGDGRIFTMPRTWTPKLNVQNSININTSWNGLTITIW